MMEEMLQLFLKSRKEPNKLLYVYEQHLGESWRGSEGALLHH
jgi:hypothetical protein